MVIESLTPEAGPSSLPSKPKNKRKWSIVDVGTPESSSSAKAKTPRNDDEQSRKGFGEAETEAKEKREKAIEAGKRKGNASFDDSADFIALPDDDDDAQQEEEKEVVRTRNGKGKERESDGLKSDARKGRKRSRSLDRHENARKERIVMGTGIVIEIETGTEIVEVETEIGKEKAVKEHLNGNGIKENGEIETETGEENSPFLRALGQLETRNYLGSKALTFLAVIMSPSSNNSFRLHKEVEVFTKWISPSPVEDEIRSLLVQRITLVISSKFRDAQVLPFGSYATKLYLPTGHVSVSLLGFSDIDLVIMSETMRNNDKNAVLRSLAEVIKRNGIASNVSIIAKARVPIIKFVTTHGHIPVDISINQGNGTVGADVVNGFLRDMNTKSTTDTVSHSHLEGSIALRALVMITKMFLSQRGMNEVYTGGLGSYAIVSLVISFLQMHPKIRRGEIDADRNLGVLLIEFFELYGSYFNYENVGISVRDGGTYFNKRQRGWYNDNNSNYKGRGGVSNLSIEDPIDISNDISSGSYGFAKVRATFAGAHQILTATAYLKAGILSARRSGQYTSLRRDDYERPEEMSVLAHIIDITQDIINRRRVVQEVYDRRILHDLLNVKPRVIVFEERAPANYPLASNGRHAPAASAPDPPSAVAPAVVNGLEEGEISMIISSDDLPVTESKTETERNVDDRLNHVSASASDSEDDDSGKYGISGREKVAKQPPKKRRRTGGGAMDVHTVFTTFTTDDEDDDGDGSSEEVDELDSESESGTDSVAEEEEEYDIDGGIDVDDGIDVDALAKAMDVDADADSKEAKADVGDSKSRDAGEKVAAADALDMVVDTDTTTSPTTTTAPPKPNAKSSPSTPTPTTANPVLDSEKQKEKEKPPALETEKERKSQTPSISERKRSYWLSKGVGSGSAIDVVASDSE
ncbi:hypothetical protein BT96DRAFT_1086021 [Gymnopus androsaceus JB14]|uniref:polynucleotide adenylyltransferase n=1 Tax=Gymnopus androsaceus JB14 TaxID=1447944 RepID=A0A6A4GMA9_9AGAR|nr:hypothetical protein BT96DRAFT_1086021 [Gymnopus androsaceus JB14]